MDWKLELVVIPVTDVDRAKDFYVRIGFNADHDHTVSPELRFVQLTPPGSACSIALGQGLTDAEPGSVKGLQVVVDDAEAACGARRSGRRRGSGAEPGLGLVRLLRGPGRERVVGAADRSEPVLSASSRIIATRRDPTRWRET